MTLNKRHAVEDGATRTCVKLFNANCCFHFRFALFRKTLDAEMKNATKSGIAVASKKKDRKEITAEEETLLWEKGLLGAATAESLLCKVYFYNGNIVGLRAGEHRLLRKCNIIIQENFIIFDESLSKTFHCGLNDLTKKPRYVKHKCHEFREIHFPCLLSMYSLYLSKVAIHAKSITSFYLRPHRSGRLACENSAIGVCTFNKILPELCQKAGLERKTAHSLRITCASRLFQNSRIISPENGQATDRMLSFPIRRRV